MLLFYFKKFDIYRKIPNDLTKPTLTGAIISICCIIFMITLFISELLDFLKIEIKNELFVYQSNLPNDDLEKIDVKLNVSLYNLECKYAGLDIQDSSGRHEAGFKSNSLIKIPIENNLINNKGCRMEVSFKINKVPGNFHISTHSSNEQPDFTDMTHEIHELTFGDQVNKFDIISIGSFNPLNGIKSKDSLDDNDFLKKKINSNGNDFHVPITHEYYLKIVPTIYENLDQFQLRPYQFSYAYKNYITVTFTGQIIVPAIYFKYDINPISVKYKERKRPFYEFLCMTCAIVGGTFTVAGMIDSLLFSISSIFEKFELVPKVKLEMEECLNCCET